MITEGQVSDFEAVPGTSRKDVPIKSSSITIEVPLLFENSSVSAALDTSTVPLASPVQTELQSPNNGASSLAGPTSTNIHMDAAEQSMIPTILGWYHNLFN